MNSKLKELVEFFSKANPKDFPAETAHRLMAPSNRRLDYFEMMKERSPKPGAVLILLFPNAEKVCSVLIQRPSYNGHHSDQVGFPGGKMEESDATLLNTALREANEEIGIELNDVSVLTSMSMLYIPVSNFTVHPFVSYVPYKPTFIPDKREVIETVEFDIDILKNESIKEHKLIKVRDQLSIQAPYYNINGKVVWGATAMILSELNEILKAKV